MSITNMSAFDSQDSNQKTLLTLERIDNFFKKWAKEANISLKQDIINDVKSIQELRQEKSNRYKEYGSEYKRLAHFTILDKLPSAHSPKEFEAFVADMISALLGINLTVNKKGITLDEMDNLTKFTSKPDSRITLASTNMLLSFKEHTEDINIPTDLCVQYYDYPLSMLKQLLFLIRRSWSKKIINDKYSLYDAVCYAHEYAVTAKQFFEVAENNENPNTERICQALYKKLAHLKTIIDELKDVENKHNNNKILSKQYLRTKNMLITFQHLYFEFLKDYSLNASADYACNNTKSPLGDVAYFDPHDPEIFHAEVSLLFMLEFEFFEDYPRTLRSRDLYLDEKVEYKSLYDLDEKDTRTEEEKKSHLPFKHPFLGYTNDFVKKAMNYKDSTASIFKNKAFLKATKEYGSLINKQCSHCPYASKIYLTYNQRSKNTEVRELCNIGGCNKNCPTHKELTKLSLILAEIYDSTSRATLELLQASLRTYLNQAPPIPKELYEEAKNTLIEQEANPLHSDTYSYVKDIENIFLKIDNHISKRV